MGHLIFTADRYYFGGKQFSFFVYDIEEREVIYKKEKVDDLDCVIFKDKGRPTFRPYGISQDADHIYIASHSTIGVFDRKNFDYLGRDERAESFFNTHQILKTGDRLYICNTSCDSLGILENSKMTHVDLRNYNVMDANVSPPTLNDRDIIHPNSVLEYDGTIFVLLTDKRKQRCGAIVNIDRNTFSLNYSVDVGVKLHDIIIIDGKLYALSTGTGDLVEFDLETHEIQLYKLANSAEFYLRGMVNWNGKLLISFSRHFTKASLRGYAYFKIFDVNEKIIETNHIINKIDVMNNLELIAI